jgi:hypothetical protein
MATRLCRRLWHPHTLRTLLALPQAAAAAAAAEAARVAESAGSAAGCSPPRWVDLSSQACGHPTHDDDDGASPTQPSLPSMELVQFGYACALYEALHTEVLCQQPPLQAQLLGQLLAVGGGSGRGGGGIADGRGSDDDAGALLAQLVLLLLPRRKMILQAAAARQLAVVTWGEARQEPIDGAVAAPSPPPVLPSLLLMLRLAVYIYSVLDDAEQAAAAEAGLPLPRSALSAIATFLNQLVFVLHWEPLASGKHQPMSHRQLRASNAWHIIHAS